MKTSFAALVAAFLFLGVSNSAPAQTAEPVFAKTLAELTGRDPLCAANCQSKYDSCVEYQCWGKNGAAFKLCVRQCDLHYKLCIRWCK